MTRDALVAYCQSKGIVLEAWAPLVRGERFKHPEIVALAEKYKKSPAQILIRYGLDRVRRLSPARCLSAVLTFVDRQGFVVIPKSTKKERIADNANVFDFTLEKSDIEVRQSELRDPSIRILTRLDRRNSHLLTSSLSPTGRLPPWTREVAQLSYTSA